MTFVTAREHELLVACFGYFLKVLVGALELALGDFFD
jgi:hypothetical protein